MNGETIKPKVSFVEKLKRADGGKFFLKVLVVFCVLTTIYVFGSSALKGIKSFLHLVGTDIDLIQEKHEQEKVLLKNLSNQKISKAILTVFKVAVQNGEVNLNTGQGIITLIIKR